ncbi:hypothetical protein MRX96_010146 [Rhipicephalus microplus]
MYYTYNVNSLGSTAANQRESDIESAVHDLQRAGRQGSSPECREGKRSPDKAQGNRHGLASWATSGQARRSRQGEKETDAQDHVGRRCCDELEKAAVPGLLASKSSWVFAPQASSFDESFSSGPMIPAVSFREREARRESGPFAALDC